MLLNVLVLLAYCGLVSGYFLSNNVHRRISSLSCQPSVTSSTPLTAQQGTRNRLNNFAVGTAALLTAQLVSTGLRVNAAETVTPTSSSPIVVLGEFIDFKGVMSSSLCLFQIIYKAFHEFVKFWLFTS